MKTVEEILGIGTIELPELSEAHEQYNKDYPVGEKVVLHSLPGLWSELNSMSGTVWRHTTDPMWSHVIEMDYPILVPVGAELIEKNYTPDWAVEWSKKHECPIDSAMTDNPWERKVTVHGSALARLDELQPEQVGQINKGEGLVIPEHVLKFKRWTRMWEWVGEFAKQDLEYERLPKEVRARMEALENSRKLR